MFRLLYDLCVVLFGICQLPRQLLKRPRRSMASWLGHSLPEGDPTRPRVWIHAVSVGEAKAAAPFVHWLKERVPEAQVLFSSVTSTGHSEVRRSIGEVDHVVYFPLDIGLVMHRAVSKFKPNLVVLCETDYWYRFLSEAKRQGSRLVVINGKLSERSFRGHRRLPFLRRIFSLPDHFCMQEEIFRRRLMDLGVEAGRITVTGNLKFEAPPKRRSPEAREELRRKLGARRLLVIGSTHEGEEAALAPQLKRLLSEWPDLSVCVVPRHPERFERAGQVLRRAGLAAQRFSDETLSERLILVDAMGMLTDLFQVADLAVVAGSFVEGIGGHNILEPLWFGVPVLFGPYMEGQQAMRRLIERFEAGEAVEADVLAERVRQHLRDEALYQKRVRAAGALLDSVRGALDRTWSQVESFFPLESKEDGVISSNLK